MAGLLNYTIRVMGERPISEEDADHFASVLSDVEGELNDALPEGFYVKIEDAGVKRSEAEEILLMVAAVYDLHPDRVAMLATVWVPALVELEAPDAMQVVGPMLKAKGPEKMPTLPAFVSDVKAVGTRKKMLGASGGPGARVDCSLCEDGRWVIVGYSKYIEQMAPCPDCARGKRLEFPPEGVGPWGEGGWWAGKNWKRTERLLEVEVLLSD